jgi:hypothetical protein
VEAHQIAGEGKRPFDIIGEPANGFGQHANAELAAVAAGRDQPAPELVEIVELQAFE